MAHLEHITTISLDLNGKRNTVLVEAKQGDINRYIRVNLLMDGTSVTIPEDNEVVIRAAKPDGTTVLKDCTIESGRHSVLGQLKPQALAVAGLCDVDFCIMNADDESKISSASFKLRVNPGAVGSNINSNDDLEALDRAFLQVGQLADDIEGLQDDMTQIQADISSATASATSAATAANTAAAAANAASQSAQDAIDDIPDAVDSAVASAVETAVAPIRSTASSAQGVAAQAYSKAENAETVAGQANATAQSALQAAQNAEIDKDDLGLSYNGTQGKILPTYKGNASTSGLSLQTLLTALVGAGLVTSTAMNSALTNALSDVVTNVDYVDGTGLVVTYGDGNTDTIELQTGGLSFNSGEIDDEGYLHLTQNGIDIEGFTPFYVGIPGSGGGSAADTVIKITNGMASSRLTVLSSSAVYNLLASWQSLDYEDREQVVEGAGTAYWYVNGTRVAVQSNVSQGNINFNIRPYLYEASNTVKLTIEDSHGTEKSFTWAVNISNVALSWNVDDIAYHGSEVLTLRLTPSGRGTKTVEVKIDGVSYYTEADIDKERKTILLSIPAQSHGKHVITASMSIEVDGESVDVPTLTHTGVWVESGQNAKIVAIHQSSIDARQYELVDVKWMVYDPENFEASATLKDGATVVSNQNVTREVQTWSYLPTEIGTRTLSVTCGAVSDSVTVNVSSIGIDVSPITAGLIMDLNPIGHSNSEANRASFGYKDAEGTNHPLTFSQNFDWENGGFKRDSKGVTAFVVKRGTRVTFDRSLFIAADNTNGELGVTGTGKHISMIFKTENVTDYETQIAHSYDSGVGLRMNAHNASFGAGNSILCQYCEKQKVEMSLNIDPTTATMKLWLEGTPAKGTTFLTGSTKTQFIQGNPDAFTIGSDDCDVWVYRFKMYNVYLSDRDIMQNFIADAGEVNEMLARYIRNDIYDNSGISISKLMEAAPQLHVITIETGGFPGDKGSAGNTACKIIHQIGNGVAADQWYAENALYTLQGTSSMNYRQCAGNVDINMKKTTIKVLSTDAVLNGYAMTANSIPVKYFNLKANVASSEHANNRCIAELFNMYNPLVSMAKKQNPMCRDTVEGHPCAVFIKNTSNRDLLLGVNGARTIAPGETILYFAGDMNNSKKNTEVFGQTGEWDDENHQQFCIEFKENTYTRCTFKTSDFENEGWSEDGTALASHFEFRYPDGAGTQWMKDKFIEMHHFVNSTDPEQATNENLDLADRFDSFTKDTPAYRRAKFKKYIGDYFDLPNLRFYYLVTEFFLGVDNRGKNLSISYEPDENGVWRFNIRAFYDGDTILGIDNKGQFRWGEAYSIEDIDGYEDTDGGNTVIRPYFNAAENVLFCNTRDCFVQELIVDYNEYENAGLFDAENIIEFFDNYQRIRPEALVIEDYSGKYDAPIVNAGATNWMENMEHGEKRPQRRQFLTYRELYMSSKYNSSKAKSDLIMYQAMPGHNFSAALEVTPYSDMYVGFLRDNTPAGNRRMTKGETAVVQCLDGNGDPLVLESGELNIQLINGRNIMHVGGAAYLYPGQVSITNGEKLRDLLLGGEYYSSNNLKSLALNTVPLVKDIDLRGQSGISGTLDFTRCTLLENLQMAGTGETDVYLPQGGTLAKAILGSNVRSLYAMNLPNLTSANFSCSGVNLATIRIENAPGIPSDQLVANSTKLTRGRITGVNWDLEDADILLKLSTLKGIDESGNPLEEAGSFYLSGQAHIDKVTNDELRLFIEVFPDLLIDYDEIVSTHTVTFQDEDGTVLTTQSVRDGTNAKNPITTGAIEEPYKAPTVDYVYTYLGWDTSLDNVTADRVIKAVYTQSVRTYQVRYFDDNDLLETHTVEAHGSADYEGSDLVAPTGMIWMGFDASAVNVVQDMDIHALYITPTVPDSVPASYDYLYSDDPNDNSAYTLAEFYGIIQAKRGKDFFRLGDEIKIVPNTNAFADTSIVLQVADFNHFRKANSQEFAHVVFLMKGAMNAGRGMNSTNTNAGGWDATSMRTYLNTTVFNALPRQWKAMIAQVQTMASIGETKDTIKTSIDRLFLASQAEVGFNVSDVPYKNEVDAEAEHVTFPIFTNNNSRIRKTYNGGGSAVYWWLRSAWASYSTYFAVVYANGSSNGNTATSANSIVFGFCA